MKKIYNYFYKLVLVYILLLSIFSVSTIEFNIDHYGTNIKNTNKDKVINSNLLVQNHQEKSEGEQKEDTNKNDKEDVVKPTKTPIPTSTPTPTPIPTPTPTPKPPVQEVVNIVDTTSFPVLSQETINMSHYGHDCYGCTSGYTASGYYVGDGRIYYQDKTFGSVRVVAADSKYPLGTIVRIGYNGSTITAIVLDRGGAIGDGKRFQIDLLTTSNSKAYELGIVNNTNLEVLRLGY